MKSSLQGMKINITANESSDRTALRSNPTAKKVHHRIEIAHDNK
jgi:hypothetical protein